MWSPRRSPSFRNAWAAWFARASICAKLTDSELVLILKRHVVRTRDGVTSGVERGEGRRSCVEPNDGLPPDPSAWPLHRARAFSSLRRSACR